MAKKFLCVGEPYKAADGTDKVFFNRIGEMFESRAGKTYCKLYMLPGVLIHVFEDKPKEQDRVMTKEEGEDF
jgi:hypothetical protein